MEDEYRTNPELAILQKYKIYIQLVSTCKCRYFSTFTYGKWGGINMHFDWYNKQVRFKKKIYQKDEVTNKQYKEIIWCKTFMTMKFLFDDFIEQMWQIWV